MNAEQTKAAIVVMQHFVDGGTVQTRERGTDHDWVDLDHSLSFVPSWDWFMNDYRIKPRVPREYLIALDANGETCAIGEIGSSLGIGGIIDKVIRVREVIE